MKRIGKLGCLMLAGVALTANAACNRAAEKSDKNLSNSNAAKPVASAPVKKTSSFFTSEKTPSGEDIYRMTTGGIKFVLPKTWTALPDESQMALASEDNALRVTIVVPESEDYESVVNNLPEELGRLIQNAKPSGVATQDKLKGMQALTQHGIGDMDDTSVHWKIDVVKAKRPIIILTYTTMPEIDDEHNADYFKFMDSIAPLS